MSKFGFMDNEMQRRASALQLRELKAVSPLPGGRIQVDGRRMVNFCSNDYLGLSKHPLLQQRAATYMARYGTGSTASRLICGTYDCFETVEQKLADLKGTESALILNSGYQANVSIIPSLVDRDSLILSDRLNHSSIIQGIRLARCHKMLYDHNNIDHLDRLLSDSRSASYSRVLIVSESVFSMGGDQSNIDELIDLAAAHHALLMVDEAHATGVMGSRGMGLTAGKDVDVTMGTFGKALGSFGAYMAGSKRIRDYLVNCCAGFIYTTALPPPVVGSIDAALDLVPGMEEGRASLRSNADFLRRGLEALGYDTGDSTTQIVPVILGNEEETLALSERLESNGFLAMAIRPPTVPRGQSRIRISLSTDHTREQVKALVDVFRK